MSEPAESEADLVRGFEADRWAALGRIFDRYGGMVYGFALNVLGTREDAEDLTQDVFLTLYQRWRYDPRRGSLAAFLVTLTRSRALDRLRARGRHARLLRAATPKSEPPAPEDPLEDLSVAERVARVRAALAALPESERRALELAYFHGLSQPQIAGAMAAPLGTVKSWMRRGARRLRGELDDLIG